MFGEVVRNQALSNTGEQTRHAAVRRQQYETEPTCDECVVKASTKHRATAYTYPELTVQNQISERRVLVASLQVGRKQESNPVEHLLS